jgi:hypothetical protein
MNEDITVLKESRNQIAIRHGLPSIGAMMVNKYGIEWLVDGHLFVPTLSTIARQGVGGSDSEDPRDLYPVVIPQNLSPRLTDFLAETDRCTSKGIIPLDTLPFLRPHSAHPGGHWIDGLTSPQHILMFLDAARAHETVIAHEIGHIWIDAVEDCEDYRTLKDLSDTAKVFMWTNLQSFVLDNKVNAVLREKSFDMSVIEADVEEALATFATAILSGYRPTNARKAVFVASTLATAMLDHETGALDALQSLDMAAMVFQRDLADVYELACHLAASVRRHGYSDRASIRRAIDECALLSFAFVGDRLDLDNEMVLEMPTEDYEDKYPDVFPGWPVQAKLEVPRAMAKMKIPADTEAELKYTPGGSVQIRFAGADGWTAPIVLQHVRRMPNDIPFAENPLFASKGRMKMNRPNATLPSNCPSQKEVKMPSVPNPVVGIQPTLPAMPMPRGLPGRRSYAPGLARFLSQVRLAEQLGGEHPYGYAMNNPVTYVDPTGLSSCPNPPKPPSGVSGIGSCYSNDFKNCCTDCGTCFDPCAATAAALPLGQQAGWGCGDKVKCCRNDDKSNCVTVTITDTGSEKGRLIDFGCCFALQQKFFKEKGLVNVTCTKTGHTSVKRKCQGHKDCGPRSQRGVQCGGTKKK